MKNRVNKIKGIAAGILAATLLLSGCGVQGSIADEKSQEAGNQTNQTTQQTIQQADTDQAQTNAGSSQAASAEKKDHGKLSVSYPAGNIRIAVNILALKKGYFENEGVEITPVAIGGTDALTAINESGGTLDILSTGFVPDVQAIGAGYDLTFVGGTAVEGGAVIARKGNAEKFKGGQYLLNLDAVTTAKLGFVRNESSWVISRQYLLDNGVAADVIAGIENESTGNISYYKEATETALAVQKGQIELGFLPMEFALLYADAYDLEIVVATGELSPNYVCCRDVTSKSRLADKYDSFVAYETARIKAFEYYKQGETDETVRKDVVETVAEYSGKETDYVELYLYGGVTKFSVDPNSAGIKHFVIAANNSGLFSQSAVDFGSYDISQNIDTSAYKQALDNVIAENPGNTFYKSLLEEYQAAN